MNASTLSIHWYLNFSYLTFIDQNQSSPSLYTSIEGHPSFEYQLSSHSSKSLLHLNIGILSSSLAENLSLVSQNLISLAKDNGSTDNITIIVVFLRPIEDLVHIAKTKEEKEGTTATGTTGKDR